MRARNPHAFASRTITGRLAGRPAWWYARRLAYGRGLLGLTLYNQLTRERHDYPGYRTAYQAGARRRARDTPGEGWPF
jgi:hypothetical protein